MRMQWHWQEIFEGLVQALERYLPLSLTVEAFSYR